MHTKRSIIISYIACGIVGLMLIWAMLILPGFLIKTYAETRTAIILCFYPSAVLGLTALASLVLLLRNIMKNEMFCRGNVLILQIISICCFIVAVLTFAGGFFWFPFFVLSFSSGFMGLIIRVVKNVMQKAVELREENDLTI